MIFFLVFIQKTYILYLISQGSGKKEKMVINVVEKLVKKMKFNMNILELVKSKFYKYNKRYLFNKCFKETS